MQALNNKFCTHCPGKTVQIHPFYRHTAEILIFQQPGRAVSILPIAVCCPSELEVRHEGEKVTFVFICSLTADGIANTQPGS